ncbi:MAG: ribonuclease HI [Lachnospiraceae bacterium]|nr:ribonuclease HI [Lachnospiraceae bacterium]
MGETLTAVTLFSDGSSRGNPGPGGYGTILRYVDQKGEVFEREYSEGFPDTTNNRMELMGVIAGLEKLTKPCKVHIISDSQYVVNAFNKHWIDSWQKNNWKGSDKKPVKNVDLWQRLIKAAEGHELEFTWIKGHNGHEENERCDKLATEAADKSGEGIIG